VDPETAQSLHHSAVSSLTTCPSSPGKVKPILRGLLALALVLAPGGWAGPPDPPPPPLTIVNIIAAAATEFGQDGAWMLQVARCESSLNPRAVGLAGERGLFQFLPTTWAANAGRLGYGESDVWDAVAASRVTAEMWSRGQEWQWTCASRASSWPSSRA